MACDRCEQTHPAGEVCPKALQERYGTLEDRTPTGEQLTERDRDE